MALFSGQPNQEAARRGIVLAMVFGLLLFPATCTHAAGPHSLFIDPRGAPEPASARHAHEPVSGLAAPARQPAESMPHDDHSRPPGTPAMESLPAVMLMMIAATTMVAVLPDAVVMPATPTAPLPASDPMPGEVAPAVEPPPPRSAAT